MLSSVPLRRQMLRLIVGAKTYQDVCDKTWILHPSEVGTNRPAIYLDGELEKVTGVPEDSTYAMQLERATGGQKEHGATVAYQIQAAHLLNGCVYKGAMKYPLIHAAAKRIDGYQGIEFLPQAALACTLCGNQYFGHWVTDNLTLNLAAQELAEAVTTEIAVTNHQFEYRDCFSIYAKAVRQARFGELIIIDDIGQNRYKRQRYEQMRSRLKQLKPQQSLRGAMLLRGDSGVKRLLVNENEVAEFLANQGFVIINPAKQSVSEIASKILGAQIIVGVEGSQLMHGLFSMQEHGTLLTLQPPYRFNNVFKDYTDCLEMKYAFVVGDPDPNGFKISLVTLDKTLNKIDQYSS